MNKPDPHTPQQQTLLRLLQADVDATARLEQARQQAAAIIADGETAARQFQAEQQAATEREAAAHRMQARTEIEAEAAHRQEQAEQELDQIQRRAQHHLTAGVRLLVAAVRAED
jgi:vacuolar-type H+-ATPase subunit H